MTLQEKSELEKLRVEIKKYREFEGISEEKNNSDEESEDDVFNKYIFFVIKYKIKINFLKIFFLFFIFYFYFRIRI